MRILVIEDEPGIGKAVALALCGEQQSQCMALNFEIVAAPEAPEWIQLLPAGQIITGRDGRTWINDRPDIILAAFAAGGKDLPIDWEHSTQLKAPNGEQSPAAAWIKEMELREGSLWGRVEWTEKGAATVISREYRYISPVFHFEIETNRIFRIVSCGLTNQPNLHLDALNHEKESTMLKRLLVALGLPETTTEDMAINHVITLKSDHATALNHAQNPPLDKFVPIDQYKTALNRATTVETELASIKTAGIETAINTEIDAALAAGKITPATKEYYVAQCRQEGGLDRFKDFVKVAPAVAGDSGLDGKQVQTGTALNAEELKFIDSMGLTVEEYKKANSLK